jgi:nitrogen fixation NifU-like protein
VYSATILDHFRHPRNTGDLPDANHLGEAHNPLCGDRIRMALRIEGGRIAEAKFRAEACAICTAAASLLTERIRGRTTDEAVAIEEDALITWLDTTLRAERRRCATLPLEALHAAMSGAVQSE